MAAEKPSFLLDTGPLSVLCSFPIKRQAYIHTVLRYATIVLSDDVISEAGKGKTIRVVSPLLKTGAVRSIPVPAGPVIVDDAYSKDLGLGERAVIKAALATGMPAVIDDHEAFIVASRFGLRPLLFQDFIVKMVADHDMPIETAIEIVKTTASQFRRMFLKHTLDMLG
jgi:hypothetical protein